jgi:hypothetical protein
MSFMYSLINNLTHNNNFILLTFRDNTEAWGCSIHINSFATLVFLVQLTYLSDVPLPSRLYVFVAATLQLFNTSPSTLTIARASNFNIIICLVYQPQASWTGVTLHKYKWQYISLLPKNIINFPYIEHFVVPISLI